MTSPLLAEAPALVAHARALGLLSFPAPCPSPPVRHPNASPRRHHPAPRRPPAPADVRAQHALTLVCAEFGCAEAGLLGKGRWPEIVLPRWVAWWLLHGAGFSSLAIGALFDRDHASVLHGLLGIERALRTDGGLAERLGRLRERFAGEVQDLCQRRTKS